MLAALRHPAFACQQRRLDRHGQPRAVHGCAGGTRLAASRTNTAARRCGRRPGPKARGPPRLQGAWMPLQP